MQSSTEQCLLRQQVGWVDARPCGVSQLRWHACSDPNGGPCAAGTQLLLAAGATDGAVHLFQQSSGDLAQAGSSAGPRGNVLLRLGMPLQPDMRAVTCLAVAEQASPSAAGSGETDFYGACVCLLHKNSNWSRAVQLPSMLQHVHMSHWARRRPPGAAGGGKAGRHRRGLAEPTTEGRSTAERVAHRCDALSTAHCMDRICRH